MELSIEFRTIQCPCGLIFAIPEGWALQREKDHRFFFCPACKCDRYYPQESDQERLKRLLNQERNCCISAREEANSLERSRRAYKGQVTRLKTIASEGR